MSDLAPPSGSGPEALARAVLCGADGALAAWFCAEHRAAWKLCFGLLADGAEADDAAQDAMLHLHDHLARWDQGRPYRAWRNTVVLNLCRDRMRRAKTRRRAEEHAAGAGSAMHLADPVEEAAQSEAREVLRASLAALSPREREAFVLRDLEGLPTQETAAALGVTESTVRALLTLARRRLRRIIGERVPGLVPGSARPDGGLP